MEADLFFYIKSIFTADVVAKKKKESPDKPVARE